MTLHSDVLIVGAGPAGLSLAISLAQAGLTATVVEQQPESALAQPAPDGREIALTHPSRATLQRLGTWAQLADHEVGTIHQAQVHDGPLGHHSALQLSTPPNAPSHPRGGAATEPLGFIVPNHALRRSAYAVAARIPGVRIVTNAQVTRVATLGMRAELEYVSADSTATPERLCAPLLVAADSRFSATRRQLGIGAQMTDFGRTVIVCRMRHARPHGGVAHECFGYERTLAMLPLPDDPLSGEALCSVVVTAAAADAAALMALSPVAFAAQVQAQFNARLGPMQLVGERHAYPLVAVYAQRFTGPRCALLGDAAVGMHPVTAHGYNLGLAGVERLTAALVAARERGQDIGSFEALAAYAHAHHRHAWPIYQGTNAIVRLYTDPRPVPRLLRQWVLQGARRLPPLQAAIVGQLTGQPPRWMRALAPR